MTAKRRRSLVAKALKEGRVNDALEFLEHTSVQDGTAAKYRTALLRLARRLPNGVRLDDGAEVDAAVARVLNEWFLEGPTARRESRHWQPCFGSIRSSASTATGSFRAAGGR